MCVSSFPTPEAEWRFYRRQKAENRCGGRRIGHAGLDQAVGLMPLILEESPPRCRKERCNLRYLPTAHFR
jgi:hypothetical protein